MSTFKAIVIEKGEAGQTVALKDFDEKDLMDGDVTVRVEYSTINYKDGLAITGKAPVVRRFPMIAGIDFAGTVESSSHPDWKAGDKVILNGWGIGETHLGAYAQKARVKGDWLVRAAGDDERARRHGDRHRRLYGDAARDGAGAARHHAGQGPGVVTGAAGGVGSVAIALLAKLGYQVHRLDRPAAGGRLSQRPRRRRDHRPQGTLRAGQAARQGALGRRRRLGRLHDARQCAVDDPLWRRGRRLRPRRRHGSADERRALHFARGVAFGHRFGDVPAAAARRKPGNGWKPTWTAKIGRHDHRNRPLGRDRDRPTILAGAVRGRIVVKIG